MFGSYRDIAVQAQEQEKEDADKRTPRSILVEGQEYVIEDFSPLPSRPRKQIVPKNDIISDVSSIPYVSMLTRK